MTPMHGITAAGGAEVEGSAILLPAVYDLVWGGLSFVIVLLLFWKFVLPRLKQVMDERAELIEGGIARAEAAQAEAATTLSEYKEQLAQARAEAAEIRTQAQAERSSIIEEARAEAQAAARAVTTAAEERLERERAQVIGQLTGQVGEVAVTLASKVVGQALADDARVRSTVDAFIAELEQQARAAR